jgi:malate dehydrogenase (quinone)
MGAGIMSATLGVLLKELSPDITIQIFERMDEAGTESSDAWHNAGTGHAAFCELNYTPERLNGNIDVSKAIKISEAYELSREFWAYLVEKNYVDNPKSFITKVPHQSFVWGEQNVAFLKKRFELLQQNALFKGMQYTEDTRVLTDWAPIVMQGRKSNTHLAGTNMNIGTDVNFGELTRAMIKKLTNMPGVSMHYHTEALDLDPDGKGGWIVKVKNLLSDEQYKTKTKFVFIGAGGATLHLLKRAEIEERNGYGGFPVGGLWLKCHNKKLIEQHNAKVYGKAAVGSPPMSVPHVDTRYINGKKELLFGPFAAFSTKFLKNGSLMDLPKSIKFDNAIPMIFAGLKNIPLTKYLIEQLRLKPEDRLEALREYVPQAELADWELKEAGQRVQVIKKDKKEKGILEFGTEVVVSADGTVAALLGASPGASTSAAVMVDIIKKCFKREIHTKAWQEKLHEIFPTYGHTLSKDEKLLDTTRERTAKILQL